jgi:hypothetical protein
MTVKSLAGARGYLLRPGATAVLEAADEAEADLASREAYRRHPQDPAIVNAAARLAAHTTPQW